ncbi:MAG: aspartate aminotransferase family protein [bacterium]
MKKSTIDLTNEYIMPTYSRSPMLSFVRGKGSRLWDDAGKEYLDFITGLSVASLGHCHPKVTRAICRQARTLVHTSNLYHIEPQAKLAKMLVELSFDGKCFFANSGAEANEGAIKLARKYGKDRLNGASKIITMKDSFHGRTLATLSATGQTKYQKGFEPLVDCFAYAELNNIGSVERLLDDGTCAIMLEPIQAESGIHVADQQFILGLRKMCDERKILLILDEVQTGLGRTGKMFAYQHYGIKPDVMTLAKSLGGGVPIGAMIAKREIADTLTPGTHASTFGGNFLATAAAIATLETIVEEGLVERSAKMGEHFLGRLRDLQGRYGTEIKEVRGMGLMVGVEFSIDANEILRELQNRGILANCIDGRILRFLPPLIVKRSEIDRVVDALDDILKSAR